MDKKDAAAALEEIAMLLELSGENPFRVRSYVNGARAIEQSQEPLETLVAEERLNEIKGVGEAIAQKVTELVETGKLAYLENLRKQFPESLYEIFNIPGLGAKRIKAVYEELGVDSLEKLESACESGEVAALKGFGEKMQASILEGIAFARGQARLHLVNKALTAAEALVAHLKEDAGVARIEIAGSLRRRKEVVKDIDIVASATNPKRLMKRFVTAPDVARVVAHGETKSSVMLEAGIGADLRVVDDKQFPCTLAHFTGSKEHNVVMRQRARERGMKLNEYGLFKEKEEKLIACKDETAIYKALDLPYIPPELREDMGEFALENTPDLLELADLRGLIHCHTTYSDGRNTLEEMASAARERGYAYMLITDHSQSASYAGGLKPDRVVEQHAEIDALNKRYKKFRVLKGIESDIRTDGSLDYEDEVLAAFDLVIASVHSKLGMTEAEATKRLIKAVENPYTHILGHPTARLLLSRPGYPLDFDKLFDACVANKVAIEINANCRRLDLDWRHVKRARDKGVLFSIGPDAHHVEGLDDVRYGVGAARKGWLASEHVVNCMSVEELLAWRK